MENCETGKCESESKKKQCHHNSGCEMTDGMLRLADEAWEELVKEKMKKIFEEHNGEKMNKVAQASVEAATAFWQTKMEGMSRCHESKEKIKAAFMG